MKVIFNKRKSIGKVLYIVEGGKTEPYLLHRIFTRVFDYQFSTILRDKKYSRFNSKINPNSEIFVINSEESNIKFIDKDNAFLDNLFRILVEDYNFDVDNAAIFYIFDRDHGSNVDASFIRSLLNLLKNSRENEGFLRQGLLLLSYPSIESFTLSNFQSNSFGLKFEFGNELKRFLNANGINQNNICEETIDFALNELVNALNNINIGSIDLDNFGQRNIEVFDYQEECLSREGTFHSLSLLCISLLDLGLMEIEN